MIKSHTWLGLIAIILSAFFLTACKSEVAMSDGGKPIVKIGYLPITHAGPLFIEPELEEDYEIELVKFSSFPDLMDALNTGRIQGASVLIELAMKAHDKEIDIKAVALGHKDGNALVTSTDINDVADLKGTTFAIPHTYSTHHLLLNEELKRAGVAYEDVNIVEMPPPEMPAALSEGRISGYIVAEPFGAQSVVMGNGHALSNFTDTWPDSYCCVLVLRDDFIDEFAEETETLVGNYVESGKIAHSKSDEVYEAFEKHLPVKEEVLDLSLNWIAYDDLYIEEKEYLKLSKHVKELDLIADPPAYDDFVDMSYMEKVVTSE